MYNIVAVFREKDEFDVLKEAIMGYTGVRGTTQDQKDSSDYEERIRSAREKSYQKTEKMREVYQ